jgi:hypothetical protein
MPVVDTEIEPDSVGAFGFLLRTAAFESEAEFR